MSHAEDVQRYIDGVLDGSIVTGRLERLAVHRHVADLELAGARGFYFDDKIASAAIEFSKLCRQFQSPFAGQPLNLRLDQKFFVWCVFGWRQASNGLRRFRQARYEIGRKGGKALSLDTLIPTPTGWTTMGEIQVGDVVFDENGQPCNVVACTDVMWDHQCYRVGFSDGTSIVADAEHEWLTETKYSGVARAGRRRIPHEGSYRVIATDGEGVELTAKAIRTTEQLCNTVRVEQRNRYGERNHRIQLAQALQLPSADLPVHPYVLGVWLGDGHSAGARLTCAFADSQIVDEVRRCGTPAVLLNGGRTPTTGLYRLGDGVRGSHAKGLTRILRTLGVINNKHIPTEYLRSSAEQRWDLLAGLMDTDGYAQKDKLRCEFTSVNKTLAYDFMELARTLGLKVSLKVGVAKIKGRDCGPKYRVSFSPLPGMKIFRLDRKQARLTGKYCKPCNRAVFVDSVEPVPSVPVRCIEVDSHSHLYLAGESMIPTHNSTMTAYLACLMIFMDTPLEMGGEGYVAATQSGQATIVWKAAMKMINASPALAKRAKITPSKLLIEFPAHDFEFRPLSFDKTPDGLNPSFIIKDEEHAYREIHRSQFDTLDSGAGTRQQPLTITITTYGNSDSVIWQESHDYGVRCLESVITSEIVDDTWFVFTCALDFPKEQPCFKCKGADCPWCDGSGVIPPDDPFDETKWRKANPGIGKGVGFTPKLEAVQDFARLAANRPDKLAEFLQKMMNIVVSSRSKLIMPETWDACRGELSDWSKADRVHGAFDLARVNDMAGAAVVARFDMVDDSGADFYRFEIRTRAWTCEDRHEDVKTPQIARWIQEGKLDEGSGNQILFTDVEDWVVEQSDKFNVATWAYDPEYGLILAQRVQEIHGRTIFKFTQSPHFYTGPVGKLEALVNEVHIVNGEPVRALVHDGDPVLAWMMTNLTIHKNYRGQKMPDKSSDANKIDIAVAVLMAISECLFSETNTQQPQLIVI